MYMATYGGSNLAEDMVFILPSDSLHVDYQRARASTRGNQLKRICN